MLEYSVTATRRDAGGGTAGAHDATLDLDTSLTGRPEAMNPAELLLAALAACMIKGIERVSPMIGFEFQLILTDRWLLCQMFKQLSTAFGNPTIAPRVDQQMPLLVRHPCPLFIDVGFSIGHKR